MDCFSKNFGAQIVLVVLNFFFVATSWGGQTLTGNKINPTASLVITNPKVLDRLSNSYQQRYQMGYLLGQVGKRFLDDEDFVTGFSSVGEYTYRIFESAYQEQTEYQQHMEKNPSAFSLGGPIDSDKTMNKVLDLWKNALGKDVNTITDVNELKKGPFRLLAVVNRMDLAHDRDPRNNNEITFEPRSLGELHLIYGLVDPAMERNRENPEPFPMVFVVAYRIPSIGFQPAKQQYFVQSEPTGHPDCWNDTVWIAECEGKTRFLRDMHFDTSTWKRKLKLWADRFGSLSDLRDSNQNVIFDNVFADKLHSMLSDIARPENFLSLKSNTKVNDNEHELREWYTIMGNNRYNLIPRRLRREPFRCMQASPELAANVDHFWVPENASEVPQSLSGDLDMFTRDFTLGLAGRVQEDKAGYEILRDVDRRLLSAREYSKMMNGVKVWASESCGNSLDTMPFLIKTGDEVNDLMMLAPFARVVGNGETWQLPEVVGDLELKETKRHAFAVRTCTGCHSQEGATKGFHIFNRLPGQESQLSPFLIGKQNFLSNRRSPKIPATITNTFNHGGRNYEYNTLKDREDFMHKALREQAEPFENLMLIELKK